MVERRWLSALPWSNPFSSEVIHDHWLGVASCRLNPMMMVWTGSEAAPVRSFGPRRGDRLFSGSLSSRFAGTEIYPKYCPLIKHSSAGSRYAPEPRGAQWARTYAVATILGMERLTEAGRQIVAVVIDARGQIQGYQTKNQLDPTEDQFYVPGNTRRLFEIKGIKFGVAICHEGWRYPETVRWAAVRGAKIVFHPQHTGNEREGVRLTQWGLADGPYYEKAMMMRSIENTIYFASVNYALRFQESATSLIAPSGECQAYLPYGQEGVLVQAINIEEATGLLAHSIRENVIEEFS